MVSSDVLSNQLSVGEVKTNGLFARALREDRERERERERERVHIEENCLCLGLR